MEPGGPYPSGRARVIACVAGALVGCATARAPGTPSGAQAAPPTSAPGAPSAARPAYNRIAVLPFSGERPYRRTAAEACAARLRDAGAEIVTPSLAEIRLAEAGVPIPEGVPAPAAAVAAARALGADALLVGTMKASYSGLGGGEQTATLRLVDGRTGEVATTVDRPGPVLFTNDGHPHAMAAAERAGDDVARFLRGEPAEQPAGAGDQGWGGGDPAYR
jgi:nucleotide-binding universal stress UspA family protein